MPSFIWVLYIFEKNNQKNYEAHLGIYKVKNKIIFIVLKLMIFQKSLRSTIF